jgi:outer membrane protein assembly factor BamE (lipoprotein component of BamABCDE complex)
MNRTRYVIAFLALCLLNGCANQGQSYANKHPELSPAHRQILISGKIPSGDAIAGMTREQVHLAMGGDPAIFDKSAGEDAWVYVYKKGPTVNTLNDFSNAGTSRMEDSHGTTEPADLDPRKDVQVRTTIFFQGNRATHAQITDARP